MALRDFFHRFTIFIILRRAKLKDIWLFSFSSTRESFLQS